MTAGEIHCRKWSHVQITQFKPKVHTICIFYKHMCTKKPLQFGKMWDQGQLQSMRKPHSSDSIEVFLL